jgi:hypothetical protein
LWVKRQCGSPRAAIVIARDKVRGNTRVKIAVLAGLARLDHSSGQLYDHATRHNGIEQPVLGRLHGDREECARSDPCDQRGLRHVLRAEDSQLRSSEVSYYNDWVGVDGNVGSKRLGESDILGFCDHGTTRYRWFFERVPGQIQYSYDVSSGWQINMSVNVFPSSDGPGNELWGWIGYIKPNGEWKVDEKQLVAHYTGAPSFAECIVERVQNGSGTSGTRLANFGSTRASACRITYGPQEGMRSVDAASDSWFNPMRLQAAVGATTFLATSDVSQVPVAATAVPTTRSP